jgi:hypothetical protein
VARRRASDASPGVAHEKFAKAAVVEHHDDAVFVDVVTRVGEKWKLRCEDVERHTVFGHSAHPAPSEDDRYAVRVSRSDAIAVRASGIFLPRIEQHPDGHRFDDRRAAADMIAVGVSCAGRAWSRSR